MDKFRDMQLLVAVVKHGSFAQAAKAVSLTPAMVGRRVAALEHTLGFMLFNRTTRSMELTPGGQNYYEGCLRILEEVEELELSVTSLHQNNPSGLIRLSAPDHLGSPFLIDAIYSFRQTYPDIQFELDLSSTPLDLIKEKIDLSIRLMFELDDSALVATKLGHTDFNLYAAPCYLEHRGTPSSITDLDHHDCLHMSGSKYGDYWNILVDDQPVRIKQNWALTVPNTASLLHATETGMGISLIPTLFAQPLEERGTITSLQDIAQFPQLGIYCMYPTRKHLPFRVQLFLDFLKNRASDQLSQTQNKNIK